VQIGDYLPSSIPDVKADGINVTTVEKAIQVTASAVINAIRVYSISGVLVKSVQPKQASYQISTNDLTQGVYIVKVTTGTAQKNVKVIVK
ncbi:MAG: T9SS type A sorting domain-containing protein, partial [Candidatus Symbiothrix sp.]|jgi:hypothetical protein|nr:T9SS type A sorting domain-containing protein [Candidatus Symbiothrix sp.]